MMKLYPIVFTLLLLSLSMQKAISQNEMKNQNPEMDALISRPFPKWFTDSKLGIFIHWGVYSVPSYAGKEKYAEWYLLGVIKGDPKRQEFQKNYFGPNWRYEDYAPLLKAELFNAEEWATLFKESGAGYVILVSKHHDGFCMWPSKYAPGWNSVDVGPHRDIVGELTESVRKQGMKMGLYYSLPEWNNPLYRWVSDPPEKVHNYVEKHMIPQFKELVTTYKPSLIFSDGDWDHSAADWHSTELISWYYNTIGPEAIVNDRWGHGGEGIGFRTPEYSSGLVNSQRPWAEVRGLGRSFGLNRNESLDAYMTPADLVHFLAKAVANGGGITINVGPYCDGQIPLIQQERLLQLGKWLKVNGEAIYSSTAYKRQTEEKDVQLQRIDKELDFNWVRNSPGKPITEDNFTATWTGFIQPKYTETYKFEVEADDFMQVRIDNKLIIDTQTIDSSEKNNTINGSIKLVAGKRYNIQVNYQENTHEAVAKLYWSSASTNKEIVPSNCLFTTNDSKAENGLKASYHSKSTRLCYTQNNDNLYAIMLEWAPNNKVLLNIDRPKANTQITLLGREGTLPWKYINGKVEVDLSSVKIAELPCEWAWVLKIK